MDAFEIITVKIVSVFLSVAVIGLVISIASEKWGWLVGISGLLGALVCAAILMVRAAFSL